MEANGKQVHVDSMDGEIVARGAEIDVAKDSGMPNAAPSNNSASSVTPSRSNRPGQTGFLRGTPQYGMSRGRSFSKWRKPPPVSRCPAQQCRLRGSRYSRLHYPLTPT